MISVEELRRLIRYDEATGELFWKERPREMFSKQRFWLTWNKRYAGKPALTTIDSTGYKHGRLLDKKCYAHRVILALRNGYWPEEVDHIDGNVANNSLQNLRATTHKGNQRNTKRPSHNKSGTVGVYWNAARDIWTAQIHVDGKSVYIGEFASMEHAKRARKTAEAKHGFHPNHGREA